MGDYQTVAGEKEVMSTGQQAEDAALTIVRYSLKFNIGCFGFLLRWLGPIC